VKCERSLSIWVSGAPSEDMRTTGETAVSRMVGPCHQASKRGAKATRLIRRGAGTAILTLEGPQTQSLWLTDIAHHHDAIAFLFLVAGHMYRTNFGIGHSMKDLLEAHIPPGGRLGRGHKGLYDTINNSIHFQLGLACTSLGVITSKVAQHMYSLPAYAFIALHFIYYSSCVIYASPIHRRIHHDRSFCSWSYLFHSRLQSGTEWG